jgi:hypothetical protein
MIVPGSTGPLAVERDAVFSGLGSPGHTLNGDFGFLGEKGFLRRPPCLGDNDPEK